MRSRNIQVTFMWINKGYVKCVYWVTSFFFELKEYRTVYLKKTEDK